VAVIGGGVAGLTAGWVLRRSADVTLFEREPRLGGHAHTHDVPSPAGGTVAVDTGFIVHNDRTYPLLLKLFSELGVQTQPAEMSMSVSCAGCGLEYAGARGLGGLFPSAANLARPRYLRMLGEIPRFHRAARRLLDTPDDGGPEVTLGAFLATHNWSRYFVRHFVVPFVSCVWSCAPATALQYPARYLFRFLDHHGLLAVTGSPEWRTVQGGSRTYVERVAKQLQAVHTTTPVRAVSRTGPGIELVDDAGEVHTFDAAVLATHPGQALALLARPSPAEQAVLGAFPYSHNETVLHTDTSLLPRAARARASWNYRLDRCDTTVDRVVVSYDMQRLQQLPAPGPMVVTLNGGDSVPDAAVIARMVYEHPVYTPGSVAAQRRLPELNSPVLAFAGAYHGWGFHEDGARSGVAAAAALGASW
jgi:predicted NAD/FAD-binding protein